MTKPLDAITVVIPVHNSADRLDRIAGWRSSLEKSGRTFEILVVDDGSTDATATKLVAGPHTRVLRHDTRKGFGACLRTALNEASFPLFFYTSLDYPYTPSDLRKLLERIDLRDEFLNKQPDLISGCRTGLPTPFVVKWLGRVWRLFWRIAAGMPIHSPPPWHGWSAYFYRLRTKWVYGVPLSDVNSCFKLYRTAFLKRFPVQSNGDFVHTELVAKATFLTSIMDEVPLSPKPDPVPVLGDTATDRRRLFYSPEFLIAPQGDAPDSPTDVSASSSPDPVPAS
jgi:glycosyltransferase involved in cell wall biosynthesis